MDERPHNGCHQLGNKECDALPRPNTRILVHQRGGAFLGVTTDLASLAPKSPFLAALLTAKAPNSVRSLRSVMRNGDPVIVGDWVVVRQLGEETHAGCVLEMLECLCWGEAFSFIRLRCGNWKVVHDDELTGAIWAASGDTKATMVVSFESVQVDVVVRSVTHIRDEFV